MRLGTILLDQRKPSKGFGNLNSRHLSFSIASNLATVSSSTSGLLLRLSAHSFVCPQSRCASRLRVPPFDSRVQTGKNSKIRASQSRRQRHNDSVSDHGAVSGRGFDFYCFCPTMSARRVAGRPSHALPCVFGPWRVARRGRPLLLLAQLPRTSPVKVRHPFTEHRDGAGEGGKG